MAPIRKAKGYVTYLVAVLITGIFGLFHKVPPAWAGDATADRNATVFHEMYRVAQAGRENDFTATGPLTNGRSLQSKEVQSRQWVIRDSTVTAADVSKSIEKATESLVGKVRNQADLTAGEAALLSIVETNRQLDDLRIQIEVLTKALNALQTKPAD